MSRISAVLALTLVACGGSSGAADIGAVEVISPRDVSDLAPIHEDIAVGEGLQASEIRAALPVAELVWAAVEKGCTEESLAELAGAEPGEVRSAVLQLHKEL